MGKERASIGKMAFEISREFLGNYRITKISERSFGKASGPPLFPLLAKEGMKGWSGYAKFARPVDAGDETIKLVKLPT